MQRAAREGTHTHQSQRRPRPGRPAASAASPAAATAAAIAQHAREHDAPDVSRQRRDAQGASRGPRSFRPLPRGHIVCARRAATPQPASQGERDRGLGLNVARVWRPFRGGIGGCSRPDGSSPGAGVRRLARPLATLQRRRLALAALAVQRGRGRGERQRNGTTVRGARERFAPVARGARACTGSAAAALSTAAVLKSGRAPVACERLKWKGRRGVFAGACNEEPAGTAQEQTPRSLYEAAKRGSCRLKDAASQGAHGGQDAEPQGQHQVGRCFALFELRGQPLAEWRRDSAAASATGPLGA
eukprot:scaffold156_cov308-Prasinococcus_capsulatus_cf.AAC.29